MNDHETILRELADDSALETYALGQAACIAGADALAALRAAPPAPTPAPTADLVALVQEWQRAYDAYCAPAATPSPGEFHRYRDAAGALRAWTPAALSSPVGETPAPRKSDLPCVCGHEYDDHFHGPSHNGAPYCNECHCGQYVAVRTITRRGETPADRKEPTS